MISPIQKSDKVATIRSRDSISEERFSEMIKEIYDVMLRYSYSRKITLRKDNPIQIGNVSFWFETDKSSEESVLKFNQSVKSWNESAIQSDINSFLHDIYFTG